MAKVQTTAPPIQNAASIVTACATTAVFTAVLFAIVCVTYQTRSSLRKTCKRTNIHTNNKCIIHDLLIHWVWLKIKPFHSTLLSGCLSPVSNGYHDSDTTSVPMTTLHTMMQNTEVDRSSECVLKAVKLSLKILGNIYILCEKVNPLLVKMS